MNHVPFELFLLAASGRSSWDAKSIAFHLTVVSVAVVLVWLAITQITRLRTSWARHAQSPAALFAELCQVHKLTRSDRRLLAIASEAVPQAECCRVFIEPTVLQQFSRENPDEADNCRALLRALFGRAE